MGFENIKGQKIAIQMLKNSIINNHLSHAYLFVGPEGVGKKATGLALAQALNCLNLDHGVVSCNNCISCRKIISGNHPDVEIIKPDGLSIKIDQVRNLRNKIFYKCYESKYKVIILNDAHFLTIEAANGLLKVMEEPPENTVFILVTSEPQQLPDTILSRCQQVQFQALSSFIIKEILIAKYPDKEAQLSLIASLSRGSLVKAEELIREGELLSKRSETINVLKKIFDISVSELAFWCEKWDKDKQSIKTIFELMQFWYRDLLVWRTTGQEDILINQDFLVDIKKSRHTLLDINNILSSINKSRKYLDYNVNPRLVLEVFLMKIKLN
ncbi:MAG: polymerase subunit delta [Clostridia bacterium]|nr:polymerase subunit delta [Clostridia bacterium]MDN5321551.1 polymerase subunit delta [Clostridia bacterium]